MFRFFTRKDRVLRKGFSLSPEVDHLTFKCLNLSSAFWSLCSSGFFISLFLSLSTFRLGIDCENFPASHHIGHRQHSPGGQGVRNSSLRVVIPGSMNNSGLQTNDEITYNEVRKKSDVFCRLDLLFYFQFWFLVDIRPLSHVNWMNRIKMLSIVSFSLPI